MPAHITGATAGSAARFAGIDTSGTASKWTREQRRRGDACDRGEPESACDGAARRERPRGDDPGDRREGELPAGVARHPRVRGQGHDRCEQQRVRTPMPAARPRARQARPPPSRPRAVATGRHRPAARTGRSARAGSRRACGARGPRAPSSGSRERAQEHHVLAADCEQMCKSRVAPVVARQRVDRLVLAKDHAAQQRRLVRREARPRSPARRVGGRSRPRLPRPLCAARRLHLRQAKLMGDALPAQVRGPVEARPSPWTGGFAMPRTVARRRAPWDRPTCRRPRAASPRARSRT